MKLPDIKTRNKLRDARIVHMYASDESVTCEDVGKVFGLTRSRIQQILYKNKHLLRMDIEYENYQQIRRAKGHIRKSPESKRDPLEWEAFLDKKINGEKPLVDQSKHTHITIVRPEQIEQNGRIQVTRENQTEVVSG